MQGARQAAGDLAYHTFGRNPKATGIAFAMLLTLLLVFIVLTVVYANRYSECNKSSKGAFLGTNPLGNLNTGSNNPLWNMQMGDAGWGGSMHSTYQPGQSRVYGASAVGGHTMATAPVLRQSCGGGQSPAAAGEASALTAVQALDASSAASAKHMSDDALIRVMNGGL